MVAIKIDKYVYCNQCLQVFIFKIFQIPWCYSDTSLPKYAVQKYVLLRTTMATDSLIKQLQKSFRYLESARNTFTETTKLSKDNLSNLCNLSEQYSCCNKVDFQLTGLKHFSQIKTRTLAKIQVIMEKHLSQLWQEM